MNDTTNPRARMMFDLGNVYATQGARDALQQLTPEWSWEELAASLVGRHVSGDWGDLDKEDSEANRLAAEQGGLRILSAYPLNEADPERGKTIWIITEADRSATTLLLPEEY